MAYPNDWAPPYADADVIEKSVPGGKVRTHIPRRTPEQEQAFRKGLDRAIRKALPGRRLKMSHTT